MTVEHFAAPSAEQASHILRDVSFADRLLGGSLHGRAGIMTMSLYSLTDVFALLNTEYPQIDVLQLAGWIRAVIHDHELADRIESAASAGASDQATLTRIRDLIGLRLIQCRQLAGAAMNG